MLLGSSRCVVIVVPATKDQCEAFTLTKHYARRKCIFWQGFALVVEGKIEGVVIYGQPSPPIQKHAFKNRDFKLMELSRLVIQTAARNAASVLVGRSLAMLENPSAVVSYADTEMGHAGIVYQATNWIYTGATKSHDHAYLVDGKRVHPMSLRDRGITNPKEWALQNGIQTVPPCPKHRYFFLNGNRRDRRRMEAALIYSSQPYPKLQKTMYDAGDRVDLPYCAPSVPNSYVSLLDIMGAS